MMIIRCKGLRLLASMIFLIAILGARPVAAIDLDGIRLTPSFTYKGEYDDNVLLTRDNKRTDYVNTFSPGIAVEATPGKHEFKASYRADILRYSNRSNLDTIRHFAGLSGILNFARTQLRMTEDFRRTDDFPTSELTQRILRNENLLSGGADYDFAGRWGVGTDLTWGNINYLRSDFDFLDRNTYTAAGNLYYRITAKTRVFGEYNYVDEPFTSDKTRSNTRHRGLVGVRGDLTERLSLTAKGGYERLDFRDESHPGQNNFVASLEGNYRPVERLQIGLLLRRSVESSTFANNAEFGSFNATLGVTYAFTPKVTLTPRGFIGVDNFQTAALNNGVSEKRLDYLYGGGLGIRYQVQKWLRLDANYDFSRRDSNFNNFNYDDNRVSFAVTLSM